MRRASQFGRAKTVRVDSGPLGYRTAVTATQPAPAEADDEPAVPPESAEAGDSPQVDAELIANAEAEAEELSEDNQVLGTPGPPISRRTPLVIGFQAAVGVGLAFVLGKVILAASGVLVLVGLALFLAIGLEPAVTWLMRTRMPRWLAVTIVALTVIAVVGGTLAAVIPLLVGQITSFIDNLPQYVRQIHDNSKIMAGLDAKFHIEKRVTAWVQNPPQDVASGLLGAGQVILGATVSTITVVILTVYLLADLPRIRRLGYRLVPASRRARVILIGDEITAKVGRYVLGNLLTSAIAGAGTFLWLLAFHVPYPVILALVVAVLDLIPIVGSTTGGVLVTLVALTVSKEVAVATLLFYVAYRLLEDFLIVPRVVGRAVDVPATATVVAVLIGGTAFGLVGALVAIPVAAAIDLILRETVYPRVDNA
jgi:predicted PurR-regulated permease PerM